MKPQPRYSRSCFFITQQYILHLRYSPALFGLTLCYIGLVYLINTLGLLPRFFAEAFDPLVLWGAMVQLALLTAVTGACALTTMAMLIMPRFVLANLGYYARELVSHLYRNMAFLLARIWLPLAVLLVLHVLLPRFLAWTLPFRLSHPLAATFFSLLVESWLLLQAMSCLAVLFSPRAAAARGPVAAPVGARSVGPDRGGHAAARDLVRYLLPPPGGRFRHGGHHLAGQRQDLPRLRRPAGDQRLGRHPGMTD